MLDINKQQMYNVKELVVSLNAPIIIDDITNSLKDDDIYL